METKTIKIQDIKANEYNPNEMVDSTFEHLKDTIDSFGFLQNILVWERPDNTFQIIDGEHRWKALQNLAQEEVEAKVLTSQDLFEIGQKLKEKGKINFEISPAKETEVIDKIAKSLTILMNEIKGENNPVKLAKVYDDLLQSFNLEQVSELLKISEQELESYRLLLQMSDEEVEKAVKTMTNKPSLNEVKLLLNDQQFKMFEQALQHIGITNHTEGTLEVFKTYLESIGVEAESEVELDDK